MDPKRTWPRLWPMSGFDPTETYWPSVQLDVTFGHARGFAPAPLRYFLPKLHSARTAPDRMSFSDIQMTERPDGQASYLCECEID